MPKRRSSQAPRADEVYTFASRGLYLTERVVITIARTGDAIILTTDSFANQPSSRHLSSAEWMGFQSALERTGFWSMPEHDEDIGGLDGHTWSISGCCGEREHSSERWRPMSGPFFELGSLFVKLAGVELTYEPP